MSIYGKDLDYEDRLEANIKLAKILYNVPEENRKEVTLLYNQKLEILHTNPFLASLKLKIINKKIEKLSNQKNKRAL